MAVATQRDLEFVIKVRDRSREGFGAATVSVRQLTAASKQAGAEFDQLRAKTTALSRTVEKLQTAWSTTAGIISKMSLASSAAQMTQSYSHFGAAANGMTFALINLAAKANVLPPRLNRALEGLNLFMNGSDKLKESLTELSKSDNFWVRLFGNTALPISQTAAIGGLTAAVRVLAGAERKLTGGGVLFGPAVGYLEGMDRMFRGRLTEGVRKATDNFWGFGRALQWASTIMEVIQHPMTRLIVVVGGLATAMASLNTAINLDQATYRLMTVANVPLRFLRRVQQEIQRVAVDVGIGATELTGAFERITGAGFQGAEAFDILRAAALGANFGMGTVVQTQDILTSVMAVYGDQVAGAEDALGVLLTAIREGKAEADQFGASFGRVFGVARQAGMSLVELVSAVTVLSRTGLPAAEGVAAVRQAIGDLSAPSRQAQKILRDLGISVEAVQESLASRGLVTTARELLDVLSTSRWTDPASGMELAGNQLIARVFDQVEGKNAILQWYDSLREATDEVIQRVAETPPELARTVWRDMQHSVALAFRRFKAILENFQAAIGNLLAGPLAGVIRVIADNLQIIGGVLIWLLQSVVLQLLDLFLASRLVEGAFVFLSRLVGGFKLFGVQLGQIAKSLGLFAKQAWAVLSRPLNIGAIIMSLNNVMFKFRATLLSVREMAGKTREYMRLAFLNPAMALSQAVGAARQAGAAIGKAVATGINAGFKAVKLGIIWLVSNLLDLIWIVAIFGETWDAPFKVMGETVKLASLMEGTFATLGTIMSDMWTSGKAYVTEWFNANKHYIDEFIAAMVSIGAMLAPVFTNIGNVIEGRFKAMLAMFSMVISGFQMVWNAITETIDWFSELWRRIVATWNAISDAINRALDDIGWNEFMSWAGDVFSGIADMAGAMTEVISSNFRIMEINFEAVWDRIGKKISGATNAMNPGSWIGQQLAGLFPEGFTGVFGSSDQTKTPEQRIQEENERLRRALESTGEEGRLGRDITRIWQAQMPDFSETTREVNEFGRAFNSVRTAYQEAFTNDNRGPSPAQAARGYAQTWVNNVLAAERRRREADAYVTGSGTSDPNGVPLDLSMDALDTQTTNAGGGGRDPYATTVERLREGIEETTRMAKANEMFNAVKSAGLDLQYRAIEAGHSELVSREDILRVAELQGLVEVADQRAREMRIEDMQLQTEEARRTLEITRRFNNPAQRAAELAALQTEISLRRERRDVTQEEINAARQASLDNTASGQSLNLLQGTEQILAETAALREQMSIRYRSGEQYAVENAVLQARNQLLRDGVSLINADAQARLAAVAAQAAANYQSQHTSLGVLDTIRQRADETIQQMGTVQQAVADGVMRLGQGIADTLFDAAMSGKQSFAEMTASILSDIARMITRMLVMKALQTVMGGVPMLANGGVSSKPLEFIPGYAKGGAFTNSVVSNPTLFKFAKGSRMGLMGEAGPEAIMPLTRMPNGKLGVEAAGGGGGSYVNVFRPEVHINVETTGNRDDDMAIAAKTAKVVSAVIDHKMAEFERTQVRSSNRLGGSMRRPN